MVWLPTLTVPAVLYADLQCAPLLHTLHLNLCCNSIANAGALALDSLKPTAQLHTLDVNIGITAD
jgi:hypothetical protein